MSDDERDNATVWSGDNELRVASTETGDVFLRTRGNFLTNEAAVNLTAALLRMAERSRVRAEEAARAAEAERAAECTCCPRHGRGAG